MPPHPLRRQVRGRSGWLLVDGGRETVCWSCPKGGVFSRRAARGARQSPSGIFSFCPSRWTVNDVSLSNPRNCQKDEGNTEADKQIDLLFRRSRLWKKKEVNNREVDADAGLRPAADARLSAAAPRMMLRFETMRETSRLLFGLDWREEGGPWGDNSRRCREAAQQIANAAFTGRPKTCRYDKDEGSSQWKSEGF